MINVQTPDAIAGATSVLEDDSLGQFAEALAGVAMKPSRALHLHEVLGDYFHQCRNLLNTLNISMYLARRPAPGSAAIDWRESEALYQDVELLIERLQWICRPVPLRCVELSLHHLIEGRTAAWSDLLARNGRRLVVEVPPRPAIGRFDPSRFEKVFDDLVSWRVDVGHPSTDLRVRWAADASRLRVDWDEIPSEASRQSRFARDRPDRSPSMTKRVTSLAVPLLFRVVSLHGGSVSGSIRQPFAIRLAWPRCATSS